MRVLVVDNYDSFTYNLVQYLGELGAELEVVRNDQATVDALLTRAPDRVVVSPGPCTPDQAGISLEVVRRFPEQGIPTLGVCLGHQALAQAFGGSVVRHQPVHGKSGVIEHDGRTIYRGLSCPLTVGRYHSLIVADVLPDCLEVSARGEGVVMGIRHRELPAEGVQFHPESVLTDEGKALLAQLPRRRARVTEAPNDVVTAALDTVASRRDLSTPQATAVLAEIMQGSVSRTQIAGFLVALRTKGETVEELTGLALAMRAAAVPVVAASRDLLDTAGTGGGRGSFNVSTTAALIAAGAGCAVAKHGNRSATSLSGSADLLEALGARIELDAAAVARCIDETGFGFMFAPLHHQATRFVIAARRELAVRTIFNLLGPLTNPAGARRQLVGVSDAGYLQRIAGALARLGVDRALVVMGEDGLDEVSAAAPTRVVEVNGEELSEYTITPAELGVAVSSAGQIDAGTPARNAAITRAVLAGEHGPARELALANAGAAIYTAGASGSLPEGVELARAAVDDGRAAGVLDRFIAASCAVP